MEFLARILITAVAVVVAAYIFPVPGIRVDNMTTAIVVAAVLALLNAFVKPVLIILTIPITIFTLGLFLLVINAVIILLTAKLVHGFYVSGFWTALLFSLILSLINAVFNSLSKKREEE